MPNQITFYFQLPADGPAPAAFLNDFLGLLGFPLGQEFTSFIMPLGGNFQSFEDWLDHLYRTHQARGPPPADTNFLQKLPIIKITQKEVENNMECAVCKDLFSIGQEALGLPCQHTYHPECINPWLKDHNTCPVCRYELPTTDQEYERERKARMASRNIDEEAVVTAMTAEAMQNALADDIISGNMSELKQDMIHEVESWITDSSTIPQITQEEEAMDIDSLIPTTSCEFERIHREDCVLLEQSAFDVTTCGHHFHHECLDSFLRIAGESPSSQFTCPACRQTASIVCPLAVD